MKNILIVGLGRFGKYTAAKLTELGHEVMAIDRREERVNEALDLVTGARIGDCRNEDFLRSLDVPGFDVCIVAIAGDFQSSLEITSLLKELGAKTVVARASSDRQEKLLLKIGADDVIYPQRETAIQTAIRYSSEHVFEYISLGGDYAILEVSVPEKWIGKHVGELDIRKKYGLNILAVKQGDTLDAMIGPQTALPADARLLVLGDFERLRACFKF
ncbi:MAG: TrkA family potassium uptake protein [Oscillospiraceae bacterium]|nr:TrkA family potassium uptake protein [Oscillospiraceae bacterium]